MSGESLPHLHFSRHPLLATADVDEARVAFRKLYGSVEYDSAPGSSRHFWQVNRVDFGPFVFTAGWVPHGGRVWTESHGDRYVLVIAKDGRAKVVHAGHELNLARGAAGLIVSPERPTRIAALPGFQPFTLSVERAVLEAHLRKITHASPPGLLLLAPELDLSAEPSAGLVRLVEFIAGELDRPATPITTPALRANLQDALLTALLHCAPHAQHALAAAPGPRIVPGSVRRAEAYMEAHAAAPITVADVAAAVEVSLRALQVAFQRYRGSSPGQFLKERRLDLSRRMLLCPEPGMTAKKVAAAVGYAHSGWFAAEYRQRFGESPSETLRRAVGRAVPLLG